MTVKRRRAGGDQHGGLGECCTWLYLVVMASERLRAWAERVIRGEDGANAARAVGYAETTAMHGVGRMRAQAIADGLLPDPAKDRAAVSERERLVDEFLTGLARELDEVKGLLVSMLRGEAVLPQRFEAMREIMDRAVGKPAVHIHGHKDASEDSDKEIVVRVIHGAGGGQGAA